ncbi:QSER1 family protein [Megaselia abdita]
MEPAGSPWSYAYNRIVPSASTSSGEEFQHPHLASITAAAAGQSAQSLLLQAAHAGFNASANSFVSPSPIASYNPVFSQIYHHAAAASGNVQPKPAHYATNNISTPHRQAHIAAIEKADQHNNFQHQNQSPSNVSTYYGENSSSSGASPSPTTSAITSTSLSWNSPAQFIAIQQQQLQHQQQIQQLNEKTKITPNSVVVTSAQGNASNDQGFVVYKFNNRSNNTSNSTFDATNNNSSCTNNVLSNFPNDVVHSSVITRTINTNNNQQQYNCCQENESNPNKQKVDAARYYAAAAAALVHSDENNPVSEPYAMSSSTVQAQTQFPVSSAQHIKQKSEKSVSVSIQPTQVINCQTSMPSQSEKKTEDVKPQPTTTTPAITKKTPRKRQPKKNIASENDFTIHSSQNSMQSSQSNGENYYEFNRWHQQQQQQQTSVTSHDQKIQNVIQVPSFTNPNNINAQPSSSHPQPAHMQSSQSQPHSSNQAHLSSYYPAFPQQISSQYAACMSQQPVTTLYNLVPNSNNQTSTAPRQTEPTSPTAPVTSNKVIVPNIEEELKFLSETDPKKILAAHRNKKACNNNETSLPSSVNVYNSYNNDKKTAQKCGFMDSYLKFLQGDRDESPSPNNLKTGKKINYKSGLASNTAQSKRKTPCLLNISENNIESDVHKVQILSDKQILPKKRHSTQATLQIQNASIVENMDLQSQQQQQHQQQSQPLVHQIQNSSQAPALSHRPQQYSNINEGSPQKLDLKRNSIQRNIFPLHNQNGDELDDSGDSDSNPVWTPHQNEIKSDNQVEVKILTNKKYNINKTRENTEFSNNEKVFQNNISSTSLLDMSSSDNYKTGDFIVLKSDLVNDWPTIWQVDSKCILQKYEPYCQNGKMFYRNMSKYASWNLETKKLYVRAPIRIQIQSHTETIVEFMRTELLTDDTEQFIEKIMEEYLTFRDHFEIYIQTMLSQSLDSSFFTEINNENDQYFLQSIRSIDEVMNNCKRKLLSITPWTRSIILSIETWPQCHVFTDWGQHNLNQKNCGGCHQPGTSVRFLLFGQPYENLTMQHKTPDPRIAYEKLFRNIRNSWAEVESLERQKRFLKV